MITQVVYYKHVEWRHLKKKRNLSEGEIKYLKTFNIYEVFDAVLQMDTKDDLLTSKEAS